MTVLRYHVRGLPVLGVGATFGVVLLLAGCAAVKQSVGGWFGAATPTPAPTPTATPQTKPTRAAARRVYYAGAEGVQVYGRPSASSKVVGQLSLHEKVIRSKLEKGYAYVESGESGVKGWVKTADLIRRLPTTSPVGAPTSAEPPTGEPPGTSIPEATATVEGVPPTPTSPPVPAAPSTPTPRGVAPSIFNPY